LVEPFAGAAGYACRYHWLDVHLYDIDPVIFGVWDYIIRASREDILSLPLLPVDAHIDDLPDHVCQEARWLIGFWLDAGSRYPRLTFSPWGRTHTSREKFWGEASRLSIANQVQHIKHWRVYNQCYSNILNRTSTWFVDPPYSSSAGTRYKHSQINFSHLAEWCDTRRGQVIVCESEGADWLPFTFLVSAVACKGKNRTSTRTSEVLYHRAG
jgi:hypothetical protein